MVAEDRDFVDKNVHSLSEVIELIIAQGKLKRGLQRARLPQLWGDILGDAVAKHTTLVSLDKRTLYVQLNSPALANELSYGKHKIIAYLNEALGEELIDKLIFLT